MKQELKNLKTELQFFGNYVRIYVTKSIVWSRSSRNYAAAIQWNVYVKLINTFEFYSLKFVRFDSQAELFIFSNVGYISLRSRDSL